MLKVKIIMNFIFHKLNFEKINDLTFFSNNSLFHSSTHSISSPNKAIII